VLEQSPISKPPNELCPVCGAALPPGLPRGLCSQCALRGALALQCDAPGTASACQVCGVTTSAGQFVNGLCPECRDAAMPPVDRDPASAARSTCIHEVAGNRIGPYKLLQQIGEGGFGVVFMAEQSEPIRRKVALKIIKLGMDTRSVVARFEAERQALALMDHPNIAKVLDAGATETGRPYFVMELVRGVRITDYCDQQHLTARARLDLFMQVCRAIQHAHQKGIIHRDIKPSNILVSLHDGVPVPKVIDFGIAKATTNLPLTNKTLFTAFEQFMGTPAYMSPEQAELSGLDVDTRSDIYSLGVLLYELLTGRTPFDGKELLASGIDTMRRTIREKEPAKPSTRLSTMLRRDLTTIASHRQTEPGKLASALRGDLDWIVMKALEKDRSRRYETANGLALDLQRHLNNETTLARPVGQLEKLRRWCRRKPLAAALVATLVMALASSVWLLYLVNQEKNKQLKLVEQLRESDRVNSTLLNRTLGMVEENLENIWANRERLFIDLNSDDVAALAQLPIIPIKNKATLVRWTMGIVAKERPGERVRQFAELVSELEARTSKTLGREVRVDVRVYKFRRDFAADVCAGKVDFGRMGALSFVHARRTGSAPIPLAMPVASSKESLFFTRQGTGIRSLADIRGRSVAFGDTNATVSYCGQILLMQSGITATNLARYDFLDADLEFADDVLEVGTSNALSRIVYLHSHAQVIESVLSGRHDVGVARTKAFRIHEWRGLVTIPGSEFVTSRNVFVGRPNLDPQSVAALINALTSLHGRWLESLPDHSPGFQIVSPDAYAVEMEWLDRITAAFPPKPSPPPIDVPK
jgi:serine/threonine protein kinase